MYISTDRDASFKKNHSRAFENILYRKLGKQQKLLNATYRTSHKKYGKDTSYHGKFILILIILFRRKKHKESSC